MTFKETIPPELFSDIVNHIRFKCRIWQEGSYRRGIKDEDALTGDFWGKLSIHEIFEFPRENWDWKIEYTKLRGRGAAAAESKTGADGIFEIMITNELGEIIFRKSFLFQAKKETNADKSGLVTQAKKMNRISNEAGIIIKYSESGFNVNTSTEYINDPNPQSFDICEYIILKFFECEHGVLNMYYDMEDDNVYIDDDNISQPSERNLNRVDFKKVSLKIKKQMPYGEF